MNNKELMLKAINGEKTPRVPVTPHWWGIYKFQLFGICKTIEDEHKIWNLSGKDLADVDSYFFETFKPDMLHLSAGAWKKQPKDEERARAYKELRPELMKLESKRVIDEFINFTYPIEKEIELSGIYDHIPILAERYGEEALLLMNEGNPVCRVFENDGPVGDFNDALIATVEHSENFAYLLWRMYDKTLDKMRVLKRKGAHGYIGSETCVSCDILSPDVVRSVVLPALRHFYSEVAKMDLIPIVYYLGEIMPIIDDIAGLGVKALMIEEQKKNYNLDAVDVYKRLNNRITLFSNLDSVYHLLNGNPEIIKEETRRQCECAKTGGFIMACGSPLCFNTPKTNIETMMKTAIAYKL